MPVNDKDYGIVIGINDYPRYQPNGRDLEGAIPDAKEFFGWLTDKDKGGGVPKKNCELITSTSNPLHPRRDGIEDALHKIRQNVKNEGGRRFYFYFSGHGQVSADFDEAEDEDVQLCLSNWALGYENAALSSRKYRIQIRKCLPFKEIVFFMDCCATRKVSAIGQRTDITCAKQRDQLADYFIAYASEYDREAFEDALPTEDDEEPIVHGHFTTALLAALRGEAADKTGGVRASMLAAYLYKNVPRIADRFQRKQKPRFRPFNTPATVHDPVFGSAPRIATADVKITFSGQRGGQVLLEDNELKPVHKAPASTGPWKETLRVGALYMLRDLGTGDEKPFRPTNVDGGFNVSF